MINWIFAILATVVAYTLFSCFGLRTGRATSFTHALIAPFSNVIDLGLVLAGSAGFGVATYYALKNSAYAIPIIISLGLIVSFVFSTLFADGRVTITRIVGLSIIVIGVVLIK